MGAENRMRLGVWGLRFHLTQPHLTEALGWDASAAVKGARGSTCVGVGRAGVDRLEQEEGGAPSSLPHTRCFPPSPGPLAQGSRAWSHEFPGMPKTPPQAESPDKRFLSHSGEGKLHSLNIYCASAMFPA